MDKRASVTGITGSPWVPCYSFVNFVKIVTMFLNLDVLEKNLWSIFWHRSLRMQGNLQIHLQLQLA